MVREKTEYAFPLDAKEVEGGYDNEYLAEDFARYFRAFITSGIIADGGNIAESLQVVANDDMTTTLKKGNLIIDGRRYELVKDMVFQHSAADGVLDRIDRISITYDTAEDDIYANMREGEYSYNPIAPQCRRSSEYMDYVVADVRIVKGAIKVTQANITDTRLSTELCGIAFPFWKLDTGPFFAQLNSFYNEFILKSDRSYDEFLAWAEEKKAEITIWQGKEEAEVDSWQEEKKEGFDEWAQDFVNKWESWLLGETKGWQEEIIDWFDNLKEKLSENAAVQLQLQIGNLEDLKTDTKEDLVSAINSLCLSYDETMAILTEARINVTLSANGGASVEGQTVTLLNVDTGEEITKEYDIAGISFEVYKDTEYRLSASSMEDHAIVSSVKIIISEGREVEVNLKYWKLKPLNDFSWDEIHEISETGTASQLFAIGDTKDFTLTTGEKLKAVILDFNHDALSDDTRKTAGITFDTSSCLATRYEMNEKYANGSDYHTNVGGYDGSKMFTTVTTEFYDKLPDDMKLYLKKVRKKASAGNKSEIIKTFDVYAFLLAEIEVFGSTNKSYVGEGTLYPYFDTKEKRIKTLGISGEDFIWWLRSPLGENSSGFCLSNSSGNLEGTRGANTECGLAAGFCI